MEQKISSVDSHDDSYFASFTDMLIGILFIFLILLVMVASNLQSQQQENQEAEEEMTKVTESRNIILDEMRITLEAVTKVIESRDIVLDEMRKSLEKMGVKVEIDLEQGILRLPESVLFDTGSDHISHRGKDALGKLADVLAIYLPCLAANNIKENNICNRLELKSTNVLEAVFIEGHTDIKGSDRGYDNWGLSVRRAISVFRNLIANKPILDKGIVNSQNVPILGVSGYEARRPISNADLRQNRRIDLRFIMRSPTPEDVTRIKHELEK